MRFRLGELFCGPGGIAQGADLATKALDNPNWSIDHAWATDYHPDTCATYRTNFFKNLLLATRVIFFSTLDSCK